MDMIFMRNLFTKLCPFLFIAVISLIAITWFRGDNLIGGGDQYRGLDYYGYLKDLRYVWDETLNTGQLARFLQRHLPASLIYLPLGVLGFSRIFIAKLWFYLSLFLPASFMFLFLKKFFGDRVSWVLSTAASLFYIINPFLILHPFAGSTSKLPVYMFLPLLAYFLLCIFDARDHRKKIFYGVFLSLSSTLISASFSNVAETAPVFIVLAVLFVFKLFGTNNKRFHTFLFVGIAFLSFLLNFWWVYSSFYNQLIMRGGAVKNLGDFLPTTVIFDTLRLLGSWGLRSDYRKWPYFLFGHFYYSPNGIRLTYLLPILVFSPLFFLVHRPTLLSKSLRRKLILFLFISFLGVFLAKGGAQPLGGWYIKALEIFPLLKVFRESYAKFSLITLFSYTVVLAFVMHFLALYLRRLKYAKYFIGIGFVGLICLISYPIVLGRHVPTHTNAVIKQHVVKIPDYWIDLEDYTKENSPVGLTLTTPKNSYYGTSYLWESGYNGKAALQFYNGPIAHFNEFGIVHRGNNLICDLYDLMQKDLISFVNLSKILNINHYLQQNDFDWRQLNYGVSAPPEWSVESMANFYESAQLYLELTAEFGVFTKDRLEKIPYIVGGNGIFRLEGDPTFEDYSSELLDKSILQLYSLKPAYQTGKVFTPTKIYPFDTRETLLDALAQPNLLNEQVLFVEDEIILDDVDTEVTLNYKKISPVLYEITVTDVSKDPFIVVLSSTFDGGWKLAQSCDFFSCKPLEATHFEANYYANGWKVDPTKTPSSFYIVQMSQKRLSYSIFISVAAFVLSIWLLIALRIKTKNGI